mmetsp:Transcript_32659/g.64984  ORF Transcript_32659/g.64984 Transcript_32659/m.64984 type:complete len:450 (+) Transcript_32659:76-1425(+)
MASPIRESNHKNQHINSTRNGEVKSGNHSTSKEDMIFQSFRRSIQTVAVRVHHQKHPESPPRRNHRRTSTDMSSCVSVRSRNRAQFTRSYTEGAGPSNLRNACTLQSSDVSGPTALASRSRPKSFHSRRSSTSGLDEDYSGRHETIGMRGPRPKRTDMTSFLEVNFSIKNNDDIFAERDRSKSRSHRYPGHHGKTKKEIKRRNSFDLSDTFLGAISCDDFREKECRQSDDCKGSDDGPNTFAETKLENEPKATKNRLPRKSHSFHETRSSSSQSRASVSGPSTNNKLHRRMMPKRHSDEAWIRAAMSRGQPTKLSKCSSKIHKRRGKKYHLGDTAISKSDCVLLSDDTFCGRDTYLTSISSLDIFDSAFVKRSNGQLTYAILVDRFFDEDAEHGGKRGEECMKFVLNSKGATKTIRTGLWLDMIRLVNDDDDENCNNGAEDERYVETHW